MTIAFIHPDKAFLPDIAAYRKFFSRFDIDTIVVRPNELSSVRAEVHWHVLGFDTSKEKKAIVIHDYASASIAPFSAWKDQFKKWINIRPGYRLFYSPYVRDRFHFRDGVESGILGYGVYPGEPEKTGNVEKNFDFVYAGTIDRSRKLDPLFESFAKGPMKDRTLLVLSRNYEPAAKKFQACSNIIFKGPVPPEDVYSMIRQARFGVNFIPDIAPYNQQTSAKFLDYLACNIPVVSTDYTWVRSFQAGHGGDYFYTDKTLSNFIWDKVTDFPFTFPKLDEFSWEKQIRGSGVLDFLGRSFPDLRF